MLRAVRWGSHLRIPPPFSPLGALAPWGAITLSLASGCFSPLGEFELADTVSPFCLIILSKLVGTRRVLLDYFFKLS